MDEHLASIFRSIGGHELRSIATGALAGLPVDDPGELTYETINKSHAEARTIGIVRLSAVATAAGERRPWSAVAKLIDLAVPPPPNVGNTMAPQNEEFVYRDRYFADLGQGLRPAHCHHISHPRELLTILWLEDLTGARGAPFAPEELAPMARHLGEWNACVALDPPDVRFNVGFDYVFRRYATFGFQSRLPLLAELADAPVMRAMYARQPLSVASDLVEAILRLHEVAKQLPHALSLGDCPIGNFFYREHETVAVDWAGLGIEPIGGDGGCFVGSALTWGRQFAEVAEREHDLFEAYAAGFVGAGSPAGRRHLRIGYLAHLGFYLSTTAMLPTLIAGPRALLTPEYMERRYDAPLEVFTAEAARVIDLLPSYVDEIHRLLP